MFAVPGWSLSPALLKKQTENDESGSSSKKRKRKEVEAKEVTSDSLGSLYQQHVEKTKVKKPKRPDDGSKDVAKLDRQDPKASASSPQTKEASRVSKSQKAEFRKAKREAQSQADKQKALDARQEAGGGKDVDKKKKKKQKLGKDTNAAEADSESRLGANDDDVLAQAIPASSSASAKLTPMQAAMRQKLIGARFRHLNETLYTSPSAQASKLFDDNPAFFEEYHAGFRSQVETWPENPIDTFVNEIQERAKVKGAKAKDTKNANTPTTSDNQISLLPLPTTNGTCKIADLGCGDAALASKVSKLRLNVQVLSYDLSKPNKFVTKADIANLPLQNDSINVAVFCLALMGTNWIDFIEEAWRVLHWKGELWVAEIKSRFGKVQQKRVEHSVGNRQKKRPSKQDAQRQKETDSNLDKEQLMHEVDEVPLSNQGTDVSSFVQVLQRRGFALQDDKSVDLSNKMFVRMRFVKALTPSTGKNAKDDAPQRGGGLKKKKSFIDRERGEIDEPAVLKPCLYKIR